MLNRDRKAIRYLLFVLLLSTQSCVNKPDANYKEFSTKLIGVSEYNKVFQMCSDTLYIWKLHKICGSLDSIYSISILDSILCFNRDKTRLITCILNKNIDEKQKPTADGIFYLYGEKINGLWYFFKGPFIVIPREMVKNHPINKPLSNQQLHQIALKEVYGGYLTNKGEINEAWFISHFEGNGWGDFNKQDAESDWFLKGRRYKTKKEYYEAAHLDKVANNWCGINKDSIKQLTKKDKVLP